MIRLCHRGGGGGGGGEISSTCPFVNTKIKKCWGSVGGSIQYNIKLNLSEFNTWGVH